VIKEYIPDPDLVANWYRYALTLALCFKAPEYFEVEEYIVQGIPRINKDEGSVTIQTEVSEGTSVWFSSRDKEKLATGLDRMAAQVKEQLGGEKPPKLVFQFDCASRGKMMSRDQERSRFSGGFSNRLAGRGFRTFIVPSGSKLMQEAVA
jgi:hypothetical protein